MKEIYWFLPDVNTHILRSIDNDMNMAVGNAMRCINIQDMIVNKTYPSPYFKKMFIIDEGHYYLFTPQ